MAPNISDCILAQDIKSCQDSTETKDNNVQTKIGKDLLPDPNNNNVGATEKPQSYQKPKIEQPLVWRNIVIIAYAHIACGYGLYHMCTDSQRGSVIFGRS